jgi:hypothetical protein
MKGRTATLQQNQLIDPFMRSVYEFIDRKVSVDDEPVTSRRKNLEPQRSLRPFPAVAAV